MIRLNGSIFIAGEEIYFEDFEIEIDEDLDIPFDDFDDFDEDCDCDDCDCDCDDDEFLDPIEKLVEEYVEVLSDECICPDCIRGVLTNFVFDLIDGE